MNLLLDTSTFLWIILDAPDLSPRARELFRDPGNRVYLSAVSAWEIAIKHALGKLPLPESPTAFIPQQRTAHGILSLPFDEDAALRVASLPAVHRDPFDRALVSQATSRQLLILTNDPQIAAYGVPTEW